jgi:hypothetical protein
MTVGEALFCGYWDGGVGARVERRFVALGHASRCCGDSAGGCVAIAGY